MLKKNQWIYSLILALLLLIMPGCSSKSQNQEHNQDELSETSWFSDDDYSQIIFSADNHFEWYLSPDEKDDNYFAGTYSFSRGQEAMDYITETLSGYGVTKAYLKLNYFVNDEFDLDNFVALTLNNETFILDGEQQTAEAPETYYYGFLRENASVLNVINMDTDNSVWFVKEDNKVGDGVTDSGKEKKEEVEVNKQNEEVGVKVFKQLMTESALTGEYAQLALDTYFYIDDKLTYTDLGGASWNTRGSSFDEVKEAIDQRVEESSYELLYDESYGGAIGTFFFLDPASTVKSYDDMVNFPDMTFYFMEDELYFSNIASGTFSLETERMHLKEVFEEKYSTIADLENMDPQLQVFSLAQVQLGDKPIYQLMVPTREKENGSPIIANYIHVIDRKEVTSIYKDFEEVSQSFPRQSYWALDYFLDEIFSTTEKE